MRESVYDTPTRAEAVSGVEVHAGVHRRVSWGAVIAGVVITLALQILLSMLGLGVGFTTVDPAQTGGTPQASTLGTGAGIWWTVSYMIALAIGGYVAARLAGVAVRGDGILHGLVTWAFALLLSAWLVTTAVGSVLGSTANMLGSVASGIGSTVQQAAPEALRATGLTPEELRNQADQLLRPEGQPQSADDARREMASLVSRMASGDQAAVDQARDRAVQIVAQQAGIPEDQARQRVQEMEQSVRQTGQQVQQTATNAAEATTDTLAQAGIWGTVALVLGAVAGMIGGAVGTRRPEDMVVTSTHR